MDVDLSGVDSLSTELTVHLLGSDTYRGISRLSEYAS
jgi:hypothetical protein